MVGVKLFAVLNHFLMLFNQTLGAKHSSIFFAYVLGLFCRVRIANDTKFGYGPDFFLKKSENLLVDTAIPRLFLAIETFNFLQ